MDLLYKLKIIKNVLQGGDIMKKMIHWLKEEESGQGMVEYALIIALIAIVVMAALSPLGEKVADKFGEITNGLGGTVTP